MSDLFKRYQAIAMLAQELHITFEEAEQKLNAMDQFKKEIDEAVKEAALMVDEMLD